MPPKRLRLGLQRFAAPSRHHCQRGAFGPVLGYRARHRRAERQRPTPNGPDRPAAPQRWRRPPRLAMAMPNLAPGSSQVRTSAAAGAPARARHRPVKNADGVAPCRRLPPHGVPGPRQARLHAAVPACADAAAGAARGAGLGERGSCFAGLRRLRAPRTAPSARCDSDRDCVPIADRRRRWSSPTCTRPAS